MKRVLLIRTDNIGDQVLTLPVLNALKKEEAVLYVKKGLEEVLGGKSEPPDYKSFDAVLNFPDYEAPAIAAFKAGVKTRIGVDFHYPRTFLYNKRVSPRTIFTHEVEQNMKYVKALGIEAGPEFKLEAGPAEPMIGISINASGRGKNWHNKGFIELINKLSALKGYKIVLLGSASDKILAGEIEKQTSAESMVGKTSLPRLKQLISKLSLHIGIDAGTTHLAAAYKVLCLVIYINKDHSPLRWGPWGTRHLIAKNRTSCQKVCKPHLCQDLICETELSSEEVFEKAKILLGGGGVFGREESFLYWAKEGLNVLKTGSLNNLSIRQIVNRMIEKNINLVHSPMGKIPLKIKIAAIWYSNLCGKKPAMVEGEPKGSKSEENLLLFYREKVGI